MSDQTMTSSTATVHSAFNIRDRRIAQWYIYVLSYHCPTWLTAR